MDLKILEEKIEGARQDGDWERVFELEYEWTQQNKEEEFIK